MKNKKFTKNKIILIIASLFLIISLGFAFAQSFSGGSATIGSGVPVSPSAYSSSSSASSTGGAFYGGIPSSFGGGYSVYGASSNIQFNNPSFFTGVGFISPDVYWPKFNREDCLERMDFIMQIAPGGCSPAVVRSDLLEEQNVPVFCKIMSIQVNPLIDVSRIRSIYFRGQYPKGVSGISYYPARVALMSQNKLISSPVNDNLGYVVIVLSRQKNESDMPDFLGGNITAVIDYDVEGAFGVGNTNFYVSELSDDEWLRDYKQYGFWNGKGYIRADSIESNRATISVYRDADTRQSTITLTKGETSSDIYLSGFYCAAGMNLRLESVDAPVDSALLQINDQQIWVSRGDRIMDNKCTVTQLDSYAGGGKISLNCPVKNGKIDLSINPGKANLSVGGVSRQYSVGDRINSSNIYLGHVGQDYKGNKFAVFINDGFSVTPAEFTDKEVYSIVESVIGKSRKEITDKSRELQNEITKKIKEQYKRKLGSVGGRSVDDLIKVGFATSSQSDFGISLGEVLTAKDRIWDLTKEEEKTAKEYYDWAIKYYEDLVSLYPNEKMILGTQDESYAAMGLYEAAKLSKKFGMNEKAQDYYSKLTREYPDSALSRQVIREQELLTKFEGSNSKAVVNINNYVYFVNLLDFRKPTREEVSAVLLVNGKEETLGFEEIRSFYDEKNKTEKSIQIKDVKDDYITIRYTSAGTSFGLGSVGSGEKSQRINLNEVIDLDGIRIKLLNINLKKQAKISIIPKAFGPRTESNFSFKIGIEKRAIDLSPKKTKNLMEKLQKDIKDWENVNSKLGEAVKGLKAACFATSAVLTVKNLFDGWSGESMARKDIMTKPGGWNEFCEKEVNEGRFVSIQKCLLDNNQRINDDISIYKSKIEETNKILRDIQKEIGINRTDILDLQGEVDARKVEEKFKSRFQDFCRSRIGTIKLPDAQESNVSIGPGGICDWDTMTQDQRREIMTLINTREAAQSGGSQVLKDIVDRELGRVTLDAKNYYELQGVIKKNEEDRIKNNMQIRPMVPQGDRTTYGDIKAITAGDASHNVYGKYSKGEYVILINIPFSESFAGVEYKAAPDVAGKQVSVPVKKEASGDYTIDPNGKIYTIEGVLVSESGTRSVKDYMGLKQLTRFKESNAKIYQNRILNPEKLYVKYFERAPYKGLPAEVPFDVDNGWYVEMTYVLSGFGKPYDESGRVVNFWLCNVGPNGLIEFKKSADDICRYYNGETGGALGFIMSQSEERELIFRAQQAIAEAARQYGRKNVVIGRNSFKSGIALGGEEGRCSDFMSPADCNIMFNVCDPVMCPSSRCDLGGRFRVDNVVQTGIIGSLMLCLPNAREGVMIPICLSGVHAGIEGYVSILNSTVQCLNESLTTGRNIGICDEIKSIYLCEFFWKQATPLINVIIPRIFESLYSQGVRGGGEYLTVQTAWDNMNSAINYFRNDYAVNSMIAFRARSTEEIGGEICKSFMSVRYPNNKNFFDTLIEPDSPVQYHAWFSENQYTTATIPSTSHYKVYYHIYAGKDQGAYYIIYLKDLPESNYIYSSQMYVVDRGYITKGSQVDQARDFTAVSGYKQLCININGKDECGFGKVSSSYLINSIADAYAAEQVKTGIKTSKECVAGTPSILSMVQPNLQAGVQEIVEPAIYNRGIIRVCATENPGKKVLPNGQFDTTNSTFDRWKEVGYCDDPTIKCWLDTSSVKNVIIDKGIENQTLKNVDLNILGQIDFWTEEKSLTTASEMQKAIESLQISGTDRRNQIENKILSIAKQLTDLSNLGVNNKYRARALYLLGKLYGKISESLLSYNKIGMVQPQASPSDVSTTPSTTSANTSTPVSSGSDSWRKEWNDSMLRENVVIEVIKSSGASVSYMYDSKKGWISKDTSFVNLRLGYVKGVNYLVSITSSGFGIRTPDKITIEGKTVENKVTQTDEYMASQVFELLKKT